MAILVRFLALALLATLSSALDQWGLWGCPDFRKVAVGIPYSDPIAMAAYYVTLSFRGPFNVISAAESKEASAYSCIKLNPFAANYAIEYTKNGTQGSGVSIAVDLSFIFKGKLPKGLLGVPDDTKERTWTIVSDTDGVIVMKTCKGAFLSHFTSTYVVGDKYVDLSSLSAEDRAAYIAQVNKLLKIDSVDKCPPPSPSPAL